MKSLQDIVNRVLIRLEDSDQDVWSTDEIAVYVQNGYDALVRDTKCIWDMSYAAENVTAIGNYTASWEADYLDNNSGMLKLNMFNFTSGTGTNPAPPWEKQYIDNAEGAVNHTALWEDDYTYNDFFLATAHINPLTIEIQRVVYDNYKIRPKMSKDMAQHYTFYEYDRGPTTAYTLDKDGYFTIRKIPVPAGRADVFTFSGGFGLQRDQTDSEFETSPTVIGNRGILRSMPKHFPMGSSQGWGLPRRVYRDTKNVRIEYFRRGESLSTEVCELPDRYVKYVELYAMSKAREREGNGQNRKLSDHYLERYQMGVERIKDRMRMLVRERIRRMGGGNTRANWPELAKLPYGYPLVPR